MQGPFTRVFGGGPFAGGGGGGALAGVGYQPVAQIISQSNAVASSQKTPIPTFPGGGNALQMGRAGSAAGTLLAQDKTLIPAAHPLDHVPIDPLIFTEAYNYMHVFAERFYADATKSGQTLVIIPCAIGGSSIQDGGSWDGEEEPFGAGLLDAIDRINAFYAAYPGANDMWFVNSQGESDNILRYTELWSLARRRIIENCPRITHTNPWVEVGLVNQSSLAHIARSRFPEVFRHVAFVPTSGLGTVDTLHFSNDGLDNIGDAAYDAIATALAADSVDLGLGEGFYIPTNANKFGSTRSVTITDITDGMLLEFPAEPALNSRAIWLMDAADFQSHSSYVVTFDVEITDLTDTIDFRCGQNNVLSSVAASANIQSQVTLTNTVTPFRLVVNTGGFAFTSTPYMGFVRGATTGAVATNMTITNFKISTIEGARLGWEEV